MSYSRYLLNICEQDNTDIDITLPEDSSGFNSDDLFGVDKMTTPNKEGFKAAIDSAEKFAVASDGNDTDIDLSYNLSFPKDNSGFEEDASPAITPEKVEVDPNTIPAVPEENDQFEFDNNDELGKCKVSDEELADDTSDIDTELVDESATGWDDLF